MSTLLRFFIMLKRTLTKPAFYVIVLLSLALELFLSRIAFPSGDNMRIGLYQENGILAEAVADRLLQNGGRYEFISYKNRKSLEDAVLAGRVDTGFVLDERLDAIAEGSGIADTVDCLASTSSTKTAAAKEEIFAAVLREAAGDILVSLVRERMPDIPAEDVRHRYEELVESDEVLSIIFLDENGRPYEETSASSSGVGGAVSDTGSTASGASSTASGSPEGTAASRTLWLTALITFAAALFFAGERFRSGSLAVVRALPLGKQLLFHLTRTLPFVLLLGICELPLLTGAAAGIRLLPVWLAYLVITTLWVVLFSLLFRKESVYIFSILIMVLLSGILTSDLVYLPSLIILKRLFPPGMLKGLLY